MTIVVLFTKGWVKGYECRSEMRGSETLEVWAAGEVQKQFCEG